MNRSVGGATVDDDVLGTVSVVDDTGAAAVVGVTGGGGDASVTGEVSEMAADPQAATVKATAAAIAVVRCPFPACFMR